MATIKQIDGVNVRLPYRGRIGCQIKYTFKQVVSAGEKGVALYIAMGLSGKASRYSGRYKAAWKRFADANEDILEAGAFGEKGGWGYRFTPRS